MVLKVEVIIEANLGVHCYTRKARVVSGNEQGDAGVVDSSSLLLLLLLLLYGADWQCCCGRLRDPGQGMMEGMRGEAQQIYSWRFLGFDTLETGEISLWRF